jgi:hypothetical protein
MKEQVEVELLLQEVMEQQDQEQEEPVEQVQQIQLQVHQ